MRMILTTALMLTFAPIALAEEAVPVPEAPVADYCTNFADKAAEARASWQAANLKKMQDDVTAKLAELAAKQSELQSWIDKRNAILKDAGKELVDIYAKMDPEAAALQLAKLDTATAAAVLRQLSPRAASTILAAIEPQRAAVLAKAIASATMEQPSSRTGQGT